MLKSNKKWLLFLIIISLVISCAKRPVKTVHHYKEEGKASWYGWRMKGFKTANGERYNPNKMTAAHRTLPFNTIVRVTNLENDKTCEVRINDRGPAKWTHRLIDLSKTAAEKLGYAKKGITKVRVEAVK